MYKVGDTVLIRKDLRAGENYGMYLSIAMSKFAGEETKIVGVRVMPSGRETYYLDIDKGNFLWTSEMFEPKVENNFEKAKSKHEELLKEREEENRKMELQQIEENLKGITELVNKLWEEVEKHKEGRFDKPKNHLTLFEYDLLRVLVDWNFRIIEERFDVVTILDRFVDLGYFNGVYDKKQIVGKIMSDYEIVGD